jgi:hypothetical protein
LRRGPRQHGRRPPGRQLKAPSAVNSRGRDIV